MDLGDLGKLLLGLAAALAVAGLVLLLIGRGVLPRVLGDLSFGRGKLRVIVPIGTSVVLSPLATLLLNLFLRR